MSITAVIQAQIADIQFKRMIAFISESLSSPEAIEVWFLIEFLSMFTIAVGVICGIWTGFHKFADEFASPRPASFSKEKYRKRFDAMVIIGLVIQLVAFTFSYLGANQKIQRLQASNLELAAKLQTRHVNQKQRESFINVLRNAPKGQIRIATRSNPPQATHEYAIQVAGALKLAGYPAPRLESVPYFPPFMIPPDTSISVVVRVSGTLNFPPIAEAIANAFTNIDNSVNLSMWPSGDYNGFSVNSNDVVVIINERSY